MQKIPMKLFKNVNEKISFFFFSAIAFCADYFFQLLALVWNFVANRRRRAIVRAPFIVFFFHISLHLRLRFGSTMNFHFILIRPLGENHTTHPSRMQISCLNFFLISRV